MTPGAFKQDKPMQLSLMSTKDSEKAIRSLKTFDFVDVCSEAWNEQHEVIEQLNLESHQQAVNGCPETIVDIFVAESQIRVLIHLLVVIEVWKEKLLPKIAPHLQSPLVVYTVLHQEAMLVNLLEILLFHEKAVASLGDAAVDLIDYTYRKIAALVPSNKRYTTLKSAGDDSTKKAFQDRYNDCEFGVSICAITISRFLIENCTELPAYAITRIANYHDFMLAYVPIMEKAPWKRSNDKSREVYEDHTWVPQESPQALPKCEAQVWLAIYTLLTKTEFRSKYEMTDFRKRNLLKLRRHLNESLFDQLPPLANLYKVLQEINIMGSSNFSNSAGSLILVQPEDGLYDSLYRKLDQEGCDTVAVKLLKNLQEHMHCK